MIKSVRVCVTRKSCRIIMEHATNIVDRDCFRMWSEKFNVFFPSRFQIQQLMSNDGKQIVWHIDEGWGAESQQYGTLDHFWY